MEQIQQTHEMHLQEVTPPLPALAQNMINTLGYTEAICTAMEFHMFELAEQLRHLQDEYYG